VKWKMIDCNQKPSKRMIAKPISVRAVVLITSDILLLFRCYNYLKMIGSLNSYLGNNTTSIDL